MTTSSHQSSSISLRVSRSAPRSRMPFARHTPRTSRPFGSVLKN